MSYLNEKYSGPTPLPLVLQVSGSLLIYSDIFYDQALAVIGYPSWPYQRLRGYLPTFSIKA